MSDYNNNEILNYIIKESIISLKNRDWSRLKSINEYKNRCILNKDMLRYIQSEIKNQS